MATKTETFEQFLTSQSVNMDLSSLVISLILAAIMAYGVKWLYARYGTALSNRKKFSDNFVLLTMTTALVIAIVKSSLALSLGLVGALSIVRFRAAIKEPEELVFLFICIALGLGLGANQILITVSAFIIIAIVIIIRGRGYKKEENQNLYLNISGDASKGASLDNVKNVLQKYCDSVHLRRFDHTSEDVLDASFLVDVDSFDKLEKIRSDLKKISKSINVTYLDKVGIH